MRQAIYSVAICPTGKILQDAQALKEELYNLLHRRYDSYKSLAHFTIREDSRTVDEVNFLVPKMRDFASHQWGFEIALDSLATFDNGTLYVMPTAESSILIKDLASKYLRFFHRKLLPPSFQPHLTIGRNLTHDDRLKVQTNFLQKNVEWKFTCDNLALRRFNPQRRQYDIVERFNFLSSV